MGKTTFEGIWDEYLELEADEKPQFLYDASVTLREQGNETAQRALLYQAIEDAFEVGDSQTAATATAELSKHLVDAKEYSEANTLITHSIERLSPWQSFEFGLLYRSMAWSYRALGDNLRYEECLRLAIAHFDSCDQTPWSYPLRNEMGEVLLARDDWSSLADLLAPNQLQSEEYVAPIAKSVREYLMGRLALHQHNIQLAIRHLLGSLVGIEQESNRLFHEAIDSLSWAIQRSGVGISEIMNSYEGELGIPFELRQRLASELVGDSRLFL